MVSAKLLSHVKLINPWLEEHGRKVLDVAAYYPRLQAERLLLPAWDRLWLLLLGPRRAGKTTLGKYLSLRFLEAGHGDGLLYLNCDYAEIRDCLDSPLALLALQKHFHLKRPIVFIDEVQRIANPGLLLKAIADLELPMKMVASGSSQLELRSHVEEHLTGRRLSALVLPLSCLELKEKFQWQEQALWGGYPQVVTTSEKQMQLAELYESYIRKDIVEILQVGKPDVLQRLLALVAHGSGQLVNYNQLATDCGVTIRTVQHYLSILEQTFVLSRLQPFVGNKRTEITSNPIYYFLDNGFRNYALGNFAAVEARADKGLLLQSLIYQELLKYKLQQFLSFSIHYWRTKSGAEVDFVLSRGAHSLLPIEVKSGKLGKPTISRSYRSFLEAYQPEIGVVINGDVNAERLIEGCRVHFLSLDRLPKLFDLLSLMAT